ncbi:MAG: XRE family transcriptional regulator [Flavobacterium sp.]|nr:MAG: XRE family transcriptional regulator [Flavobacterium sp.]
MPKSITENEIVKLVLLIRNREKKTQRDLADLLKVSAGFIGQIEMESSASMYSYDQLNEIAKYLNCSLKDFMPENWIEE